MSNSERRELLFMRALFFSLFTFGTLLAAAADSGTNLSKTSFSFEPVRYRPIAAKVPRVGQARHRPERGLPAVGRGDPREILRQARGPGPSGARALRSARAYGARMEDRSEARRVPGMLPDGRPDPARPAPAGRGRRPRAHRRQQL